MGIVFKQSFNNTLILFLGFAIGGLNVLFLYTHFLEAEYFGLITFLLSSANMIMPLIVFGMQHTIIRFFSSYKEKMDQDNFLLTAVLLPLLVMVPMGILGVLFYTKIAEFLARENIIIKEYTFTIFFIAVFMGYFEVFYAWSRVQMKSVFGNFVKEVFARISVTLLLLAVFLDWITADEFVYAVVLVYFLRAVIMMIYAFKLYFPELVLQRMPGNLKEILSFSMYIILAGSAGTILLEIDKFMIPQMKFIAEVAYYSVGVYIASVIGIPSRAMQQIINPITAREINNKNMEEVRNLYQKSSLNLLIVGGLLFLLINLNIGDLYSIINKPEYSVGIYIVLIISISELVKLSLGTNGAILTNSKYYKMLFYYSIGMAVSVVVLNRILIESMGIDGAALATLLVVGIFSLLKILYVKARLNMQPFTSKTGVLLMIIGAVYTVFSYVDLSLNPFVNIVIRSLLISAVFIFLVIKFKLSEDINLIFRKYLGL
ncbi:oligosaccharide flippase family protein [Lutimonas saemankumensis]|uniref:oligosaccharide flippase family protein n=1 Tax=Lutimonas saemankumensis TaxID=483016 RepID=UPI001CD785CB|nr:oligosaccharide flippase family protein [Lutimonas saemankumensis]MCA0932337.1 oligosaccharide flippase family protein [Lutimonas saemankumensis]